MVPSMAVDNLAWPCRIGVVPNQGEPYSILSHLLPDLFYFFEACFTLYLINYIMESKLIFCFGIRNCQV